jgi:hypothetical protein
VIFVVEDNGFGEATASSFATAGDIVRRAAGYDMPGVTVDGVDFFAVHDAAAEAVERARTAAGRRCSTSSRPASTAISRATPTPTARRRRRRRCAASAIACPASGPA